MLLVFQTNLLDIADFTKIVNRGAEATCTRFRFDHEQVTSASSKTSRFSRKDQNFQARQVISHLANLEHPDFFHVRACFRQKESKCPNALGGKHI